MSKRFGPSGEELESASSSRATNAAIVNSGSVSTHGVEWIFVAVFAAFLFWVFSPSPHKGVVAASSHDMNRTAATAIGCPARRGIELVLEAAPQGDGAVAATSLANGCVTVVAGTAVSVVEATGTFILLKQSASGTQLWFVTDVAFKN